MLNKISVITSIALLFMLCFSCIAEASVGEDKDKIAIDSYLRYMPSRSAKGRPGGVEILEGGVEYSYEFKAFEKLPVKFSLGNHYVGIENNTNLELPAHLVGINTDIEATFPFFNFNNTYLRLGVSPSFYGDNWTFRSSGFRIPMRTFLIYMPSEKWTFLAGLAVYPDYETETFPILGFIYKPNDRLTVSIVPKGPNISYLLNERTTVFIEGGSSGGEYEVTKDNIKNVVLSYQEAHLGCGLSYKFNEFLQATIAGGTSFNRSLEYRDESLGSVDIKDGAYAEFRIKIEL